MFNQYKIVGNDVYISIKNTKGKMVGKFIVDLEDLEKLKKLDLSWHRALALSTGKYYIYGTIYVSTINGKPKYKRIQVHRFLLNQFDPTIIVDHIDNNPYNNKKSNLRVANKSQNCKNRDSKNSNNTSGYRNVTRMGNWWRVQLQINGKNKLFPEKFEDVHEAGIFAKEMREKYYGEYSGK